VKLKKFLVDSQIVRYSDDGYKDEYNSTFSISPKIENPYWEKIINIVDFLKLNFANWYPLPIYNKLNLFD
jgi:hypothetical protein